MKNNLIRKILTVAPAAFIPLGGNMAVAAEGARAALEEITVTARKREEGLQDVSVSLQAISGDFLLDQGISDFSNLADQAPAVNIVKGGASDQLFIRGIGSGFNGGFEQAVGTYIDGAYIGRSRVTRGLLFDIERVELLKGPQTTFFGNSSIAGALNVTTASPEVGEPLSGHIVGLADFDHGETNIEAAINLPLTDNLAVRVAARKYDMDGYVENTYTDRDVAGNDDEFYRVTAVWEPTDTFDLTLKYTDGNSFQTAAFAKEVVGCDQAGPPNPAGRPGSSCSIHTTSIFDNRLNWELQHSQDEWSELDFSHTNLEMNWDLGPVTVTSVTAWIDQENRDLLDLDSGPFINFVTNQYDELDSFGQELRLTSNHEGPIDWMVGAYYQEDEVSFDGSQLPYFVGAPPLQAAIDNAEAMGKALGTMDLRQPDSETRSVFASTTWHINPRNRLSFGLRWIEVEKDIEKHTSWALYDDHTLDRRTREFTDAPFPGFITPGQSTNSDKWDDLLPSITYEWDMTGNAMVYASFSQGFKAGGFDFGTRDGNSSPTFDEETVDAYELGMKADFLDRRLRVNAAAFYSAYEGVQQSVVNPDDFTQSVTNASESTTQGVEMDITYAATDNLTLESNLSYLDAKYDTYLGPCNTPQERNGLCPNGFQDLGGHETTQAPEYSGSVRARYTYDAGPVDILFAPSIFFTDDYFLQSDFDPNTEVDSYYQLNGRISVIDKEGRWKISLIGKNLNDEKIMFFANDLPGSSGSYMQGLKRGRSVAIQGRFNF